MQKVQSNSSSVAQDISTWLHSTFLRQFFRLHCNANLMSMWHTFWTLLLNISPKPIGLLSVKPICCLCLSLIPPASQHFIVYFGPRVLWEIMHNNNNNHTVVTLHDSTIQFIIICIIIYFIYFWGMDAHTDHGLWMEMWIDNLSNKHLSAASEATVYDLNYNWSLPWISGLHSESYGYGHQPRKTPVRQNSSASSHPSLACWECSSYSSSAGWSLQGCSCAAQPSSGRNALQPRQPSLQSVQWRKKDLSEVVNSLQNAPKLQYFR